MGDKVTKMEEEKLQRLYDTLSKLAPKHSSGLGMMRGISHQTHRRDESLPNNPLYSRFVRAGSGLGQYHKRAFDDSNQSQDSQQNNGVEEKKSKKDKKDKKNKKDKKDKKDKKECKSEVPEAVVEAENTKESSIKRKRSDSKDVDNSTIQNNEEKSKKRSKSDKKSKKESKV